MYYDKLSEEGKARLLQYAEDLICINKYLAEK